MSIVERGDMAKRRNGRYEGYVSHEERSIVTARRQERDIYTVEGRGFALQEVRRDGQLLPGRVDYSERISYRLHDSGLYLGKDEPVEPEDLSSQGRRFPRLRDFPAFPVEAVEPGSTWTAPGSVMVCPEPAEQPVEIPFLCEYRYDGIIQHQGGPAHSVSARYAVRYADTSDDHRIASLQGSHDVTIVVPAGEGTGLFLRDRLHETYRYKDGSTVEYRGFMLTWMNAPVRVDRRRVASTLEDEIAETSMPDTEVTTTDLGVTLRLRNVHFVADQAVILPDERGRLDSIADALRRVDAGTFLVVGHTADVGTAESQQELSVLRAKAVVDELVRRGIAGDRFVYEGRGGTEPVAPNDTEENMAKNRRVEIVILDE
jgi:outer membrane protein OmpA-like peptidoglycan-associated protein